MNPACSLREWDPEDRSRNAAEKERISAMRSV